MAHAPPQGNTADDPESGLTLSFELLAGASQWFVPRLPAVVPLAFVGGSTCIELIRIAARSPVREGEACAVLH